MINENSNILSVRFPKNEDVKKVNKKLLKLSKANKCHSPNDFIVKLINNADKYDIQHFDFDKQVNNNK